MTEDGGMGADVRRGSSLPSYRAYSTSEPNRVRPSHHQTAAPTTMPSRSGKTGDQSPPGHSRMGLPNHDRHRSQLESPASASHPIVIVPSSVATPASTESTTRTDVLIARIVEDAIVLRLGRRLRSGSICREEHNSECSRTRPWTCRFRAVAEMGVMARDLVIGAHCARLGDDHSVPGKVGVSPLDGGCAARSL